MNLTIEKVVIIVAEFHYLFVVIFTTSFLQCASKAFDRVNHDILFSKLMERGIPPILNGFLLSWYKSQRMQVQWNAALSPAFSVSN